MKRVSWLAAGVAASLCLLAGCGGGGTSSVTPPPSGSTPPPSNPPSTIQGVATPSSVSVVTATNAN